MPAHAVFSSLYIAVKMYAVAVIVIWYALATTFSSMFLASFNHDKAWMGLPIGVLGAVAAGGLVLWEARKAPGNLSSALMSSGYSLLVVDGNSRLY